MAFRARPTDSGLARLLKALAWEFSVVFPDFMFCGVEVFTRRSWLLILVTALWQVTEGGLSRSVDRGGSFSPTSRGK